MKIGENSTILNLSTHQPHRYVVYVTFPQTRQLAGTCQITELSRGNSILPTHTPDDGSCFEDDNWKLNNLRDQKVEKKEVI